MPKPRVNLTWPLEAFLGDVLVCTLEGEHLDTVTDVKVAPAAKGVKTTIGDPYGRLGQPPQQTAEALTITFEVDYSTYPGEKRVELISAEGNSDPIPFTIMM
ncbi:hypothetical protein [Synechococcus sp. PCC 7336]|uniref:hypothetical protein n=1 Tax=Synechococcus sp. PCC 7336 TaxID=195250 RepID=UPI000475B78B|nr:hypothetical protein [Synechococcus sp. PCC 7336]